MISFFEKGPSGGRFCTRRWWPGCKIDPKKGAFVERIHAFQLGGRRVLSVLAVPGRVWVGGYDGTAADQGGCHAVTVYVQGPTDGAGAGVHAQRRQAAHGGDQSAAGGGRGRGVRWPGGHDAAHHRHALRKRRHRTSFLSLAQRKKLPGAWRKGASGPPKRNGTERDRGCESFRRACLQSTFLISLSLPANPGTHRWSFSFPTAPTTTSRTRMAPRPSCAPRFWGTRPSPSCCSGSRVTLRCALLPLPLSPLAAASG